MANRELIYQVLLELLLDSGEDHSPEKFIHRTLPLFLKKLNCSYVCFASLENQTLTHFEMIPVSFMRTHDWSVLEKEIHRLAANPESEITEIVISNYHFYLYHLIDVGIFIAGRKTAIDPFIVRELFVITRHFGNRLIQIRERLRRLEAEAALRHERDKLQEMLVESQSLNDKLGFLEERNRSVLNSALDSIIIADHRGMIMDWNPACEKMFGFSRDEIIGNTMADTIIPIKYRELHNKGMRHYLATGEGPVLNKRIEISALRRSGEEFPVEMAITPVKMFGFPVFVAYLRDISERKAAEQEIRQQSERLLAILKNIGDGVIVFNGQNQVILINHAAANLLGLGDEDVKFRDDLSWFPGDRERLLEFLQNLDTGQSFLTDIALLHPETKIFSIVGTVYKFADPGQFGKILVFRDVTREREIDRMKTDFVSQVSHELRTPLTSIIGFTQTMRDETEMPENIRKEFLSIIYDESRRLSNLIDNILSLSKIESGTLNLEFRPFDLSVLIREIIQTYSILLEQQNLNVHLELPAKEAIVSGDRDTITVIIVNLLSNSIKFTQKGGSITLTVKPSQGEMVFSIADTGMGIPKKDLHRVFEKFYRSNRVKNVVKGSGLGLSIVKQLVDAHSGDIEVSSEEGKGTLFTIHFPVSQPVKKKDS